MPIPSARNVLVVTTISPHLIIWGLVGVFVLDWSADLCVVMIGFGVSWLGKSLFCIRRRLGSWGETLESLTGESLSLGLASEGVPDAGVRWMLRARFGFFVFSWFFGVGQSAAIRIKWA